MPLSSTQIEEKNKLATDSAWLTALEIIIPGVSEHIRVAANNEDITWRGETWLAFHFEFDRMTRGSSGEAPRVTLRVSNVNQVMESYIQDYDLYQKQYGPAPIYCWFFQVNSKDLANDDPAAEYVFELLEPEPTAEWAIFTLGASNLFNRRAPRDKVRRNFCRYEFKTDPRCGYKGGAKTCNRSLAFCRELGNSDRFGGFPGI